MPIRINIAKAVLAAAIIVALTACSKSNGDKLFTGDQTLDKETLLSCYAQSKADFFKGVSFYETKDYDKALKIFEDVVSACPSSPFGRHGLAIVAYARKKESDASKHEKAALERLEFIHKNIPAIWDGYMEFLTGVCKTFLGEPAKGLENYKAACALNEPRACTNLGESAEKTGQNPDGAIVYYRQACDLNYARACTNEGIVKEKIKQDEEGAINAYARGCELSHATGCIAAAQLYEKRNVKEKALEFYEKACKTGHDAACKLLERVKEETNSAKGKNYK